MKLEQRHYLTVEQKKVLIKLERAFAECAKHGICFYGIDDELLALSAEAEAEGDASMDMGMGLVDMSGSIPGFQGILEHVNTHGTYRDSGGW